ncbi:Wzz/FepE/Etk N-terminal domain-containing protein [Vibrio lentus]|uniref:Chain-length determining protein n=2 Tax=Vibrio lentus TaxID=136468 RepID=A0AB36XL28_9VIBR|nr:Wzz/FepE/Etk N-terminal domain-containing protein [Vibrio lentus]MCC4837799.1 LPS chain length-determining protein [Vibrio lentus]PMI15776.1 chain-length determining protein [Vibrio lentus]PMK31576.1 chain-length determining protein [Vibrio lentus]PMK46301.1 chain-length determining protein [Vibrio lentus]PML34053.1 chain-length determining protein [Vibrio lentus]
MKQQIQSPMYSPEDPPMYGPKDEIVFKELIKALWKDKLIVILTTIVFMLCSVFFALSAQEWWSSRATVAKAQPQDLAEYQHQVKQFQPIFNVYQDDGTVLISKELDNLINSNVLFQRFINMFDSTNNKRTFLESSSDFFDVISTNGADISEGATRALHAEWFDRISASIADKKNNNSPYFVSFQTTNKKSSFDLLTSYIAATEAKVQEDAFNNLQAVVSGKRNELIQQKKVLENQAKNQLLVETERAKYAVIIANAAGVDKPIQTSNRSEIFGIDLGSKGLQAKVQALESVKNLSVIEPRLQQINAKLEMLDDLKVERDIEFHTFRFLDNVEQPIGRDAPKRSIIVLLGTLFGGAFGVVIVLIRFAFKKED